MAFEVDTNLLPYEAIKLGLADTPFLIPGEQVMARFGIDDLGETRVVIYVQDIEVRGINPDTNTVEYNVVGLRQYTQQWDVGGSYLNPEFISPGNIEETDG